MITIPKITNIEVTDNILSNEFSFENFDQLLFHIITKTQNEKADIEIVSNDVQGNEIKIPFMYQKVEDKELQNNIDTLSITQTGTESEQYIIVLNGSFCASLGVKNVKLKIICASINTLSSIIALQSEKRYSDNND